MLSLVRPTALRYKLHRSSLQIASRYASGRLVPDPDKVPRTEPIDLTGEAFKKSNTIEDYSIYDVEVPPNNIESVNTDSFVLSSGARIQTTPDAPRALVLIGKEALAIDIKNKVHGAGSSIIELEPSLLSVFDLVYPRPELLVIGLGGRSRVLGPKTQNQLLQKGMRMQAAATMHSASNFDLLASERGDSVAGFILPLHI